jgi:hypothetical protein
LRSLALIALLASFGLAACGSDDNKKSSASTEATTGGTTAATTSGTTTASSKPAAVNAACKQAFPGAGKLNAEYVYDNVVPQAEKIAAAADQAGEQAFGVDISDYAQEQAAIDRAARDPKPLEKATAAATAEASKIGASACVKYIKAYRKATASK